jgi:iron uptake system EfeUOB component EfeO/EfeM
MVKVRKTNKAIQAEAEFMHYASPYYDPVKAHEYYMRTRELKGRRSTSKMSEEQKEAWTYVKDQVSAEKKQKNDANKAATKTEVEKLRSDASATRERISAKLKSWLAVISLDAKNQKAAVLADSAKRRLGITEKATGERKTERKQVAAKLKTAINSARAKAKEIKEALDSATESTLNSEYDSIMQASPAKPKRRSEEANSK